MNAVMVRTWGFPLAGAFAGAGVWEKVNGLKVKTARRTVAKNLAWFFMGLYKGGNAGDFFSDDEFVNVVGAFVGVNAFEVVHVAHDAVIVDDAVGAEDVAGLAGGFKRDGDVVHFQHGDVRGVGLAFVFQAADMQREQLSLDDFGDHPREFFLDELVRSDGLVGELLARLGVLQGGVVAGHGRAEGAPADAVARLVKATERAAQTGDAGKKILFGDSTIAERQAGSYGSAQRPFAVDVPGFEAGRAFFHQEAADLFVFAFGPDDRDIGE